MMTINTASYESLKGLMGRANTQERLQIADAWLRGNKSVTVEQYQTCREIWNRMYEQFGSWKIIIRAGSVKHQYASGLSFQEANRVCEDSDWQIDYNGGLMWDMEIDHDWQ